jgi:uncharacterized protein (DUF885 family)
MNPRNRPLFAPVLVALYCLALAGCARNPAEAPAGPAAELPPLPASNSTAAKFNAIVERYWDDYLALHPLEATALGDHRYDDRFGDYASEAWMADGLAIEQEALEHVQAIDPKRLSPEERLSYDAFRAGREINAEGFRYPSELLPFDATANLAARFAALGSGQDVQPFRTARDYDNFLARMDGFAAWVDLAIAGLREGVAKGVVYPRPVVERTLPLLAEIGTTDPVQSVFWRPILDFPAGLTVPDRLRLTRAYRERLAKEVLPAYRRLHAYLQQQYLPQARTTSGMDSLPSGAVWYAYLVRYYTGSKLTPAEVHELGLREVARLRGETERLMRQLGQPGDVRSFFEAMRADPVAHDATPSELLAGYGAIRSRVRSATPLVFADVPKTPLEIRAVEPLRARFAPSTAYRAAPIDGSGPGVFYVNTSDPDAQAKYLMETTYLREAWPGRHLQRSLAQENARLPRFRRYGEEPSYREGWALYARSLGRDLGLYTDAYSLAGDLMVELWMSARLVVDTGLHSRGWTRERAIDYLRANSGLTEAEIAADVDRSLASPGQVLAGKAGQLKILELRRRAQEQLGPRFDVREFHSQVVGSGPLPLPVLEAKIDRWISASRSRS